MALYHNIASKISTHIAKGIFPPGSRLPGTRRLSEQFGVSASTIVQAQRQLENSGLIEARPRSGFYVSQRPWFEPELPTPSTPDLVPAAVTGQELVLQLARFVDRPDYVRLGTGVPDSLFLPMRAFQASLLKIARRYDQRAASYAPPSGLPELQQQIARRMYLQGSDVPADRILVTNGCLEAVSMALRTVAQAGDVVAIESPTFYGFLQVIESLNMKALEIPTDPQDGISLAALQLALEQWPVKACMIVPNFSNPLGSLIPDDRKRQLVALARRHNLALIEDDIFGDLGFSGERPRNLLSFADEDADNLFYCSSFSKTISPGLRVGWMVPPRRYLKRLEYLKYVANFSATTLAQLAVADFLAHGGYDRHLRRVQASYAQQTGRFVHAISKHFPPNTRVSRPQGGFVLWLELPEDADSVRLSQKVLAHKVSLATGPIFSATQKYRNCIRLNCSLPWNTQLEKALIEIGRAVYAAHGAPRLPEAGRA